MGIKTIRGQGREFLGESLSNAGLIAAGFVPMSSLVPTVHVSGRSVLSRTCN